MQQSQIKHSELQKKAFAVLSELVKNTKFSLSDIITLTQLVESETSDQQLISKLQLLTQEIPEFIPLATWYQHRQSKELEEKAAAYIQKTLQENQAKGNKLAQELENTDILTFASKHIHTLYQ